jgi:hypothetical protein
MNIFNKKTEKIVIDSREIRFKKVASRRTQEILHKIRLLGNCANKGNYSYDEEQVRKIFYSIENELKRVKMLYNNSKSKEEFKL